jgi:RNA recognition motif-containing protein
MNIYVANLNTSMSDEDLAALFTPYGQVESASIAIDGFTDLSRGFGYVDMPNDEEAVKAINALHQSEVGGQKITVREAEVKEVRRGSYKVGNPAIAGYKFRKN